MESSNLYYDINSMIVTKKNTKISKRLILKGTQNIRIHSRCILHPKCVIRGDIGEIFIGSNCILKDSVSIVP